MDKKSKEALRRYKKGRARAASSSESSSSSESETGSSSSYSSSDSERKANAARRHRKKKMARSDEERRSKREKRDHCQKKKEAKRDHLKRKLKEAKLKRKAAAAAAVLSGHSHRSSLSPLTQAKLKKLTERRHLREASKERREREKHLAREHAERSPSKMAKIRNMHADIMNRQTKSPQRMHQQLMSREKIIIQTRTHEHTPSVERERERGRHSEHKLHYDDRRERERERAEREALRDKERAEALARCQERQRERERIAREKQRREEEQKKYGSSGDNLERSDYDMIYHAGHSYNERERERERERSLEALERTRYNTKRELDMYERECNYLESDRRSLMEEGELRHERETPRRREASPNDNERYIARVRDVREIYTEDEHERSFNRSYHGDPTTMRFPRERNANWQHGRDEREPTEYVKREPDHIVYEAHEHDTIRAREHKSNNVNMEWKGNWEHNEWASTPNKMPHARNDFNEKIKSEGCLNSETDWDVDERKDNKFANESTINEMNNDSNKPQEPWLDNKMNVMPILPDMHNRSNEWHNEMPPIMNNTPNFNRVRPYRERPGVGNYRQHPQPPPALMNMNVQVPRHPYHGTPRPMNKRNMTYTNPNIIKKQQAALAAAKAATQANAVAAATAVAAAKAAAQSVANSTTNPGILGQVRQYQVIGEKPEAGEIVVEEKKEVAEMEKGDVGGGELSEISDSDDDILTSNAAQPLEVTPAVTEMAAAAEITEIANVAEETVNNVTASHEEEDMLAFEEISDGEFEEETRLKNVADALGVDWASLIAESKAQATEKIETTSAKQRWEAHRVLLQVGVSYKLAGEEFAKNMLQHIHNKLELDAAKAKDIKCLDEKLENVKPLDLQLETPSFLALNTPLACSQVYVQQSAKQRNEIFSNICGPNSRALSARQDLRLRRQLCGLSATDCNLTKPLPIISEKIKNLALNAFKCALEAK